MLSFFRSDTQNATDSTIRSWCEVTEYRYRVLFPVCVVDKKFSMMFCFCSFACLVACVRLDFFGM